MLVDTIYKDFELSELIAIPVLNTTLNNILNTLFLYLELITQNNILKKVTTLKYL